MKQFLFKTASWPAYDIVHCGCRITLFFPTRFYLQNFFRFIFYCYSRVVYPGASIIVGACSRDKKIEANLTSVHYSLLQIIATMGIQFLLKLLLRMGILTRFKGANIALKEMIAHFSLFFAVSILDFITSRAEGHVYSEVFEEYSAGDIMAAFFSGSLKNVKTLLV